MLALTFLTMVSCNKGTIGKYEKSENSVNFSLGKGHLLVRVISDNVLQCRYYLTDTPQFKKSLMVVDRPSQTPSWTLEEKDGTYLVKTSNITASVSAATGLISFLDKEGNPILAEKDHSLVPKEISGEKVFNLSQTFALTGKEAIYGLGQTQTGYMDLRGKSLELFQKNKEDYIPVIVSTNGYGLLWDNYSYTLFKDTAEGMNLWSEVGDGIDYYFMYGPELNDVIARYRQLTGGCPMLPKWAFGYVQSKERYKTQQEILDIAKEYRQRQIPMDVIVQDWQYWPEGQWGQKSFDSLRFPNPSVMLDELHQKYHTKFMISIWGVMTMGYPNSNEIFNTKGSNYYRIKPNEIYYDPFNKVSADLYWKQCNKGLFSKGVDAWWCDATEPEIDRVFVISADSVRKKMTTSMGSGARYMCAYPLMHSKNMYEGQRSVTSDKRVVNLTRSGFGGQQRYSTIVWSGDIQASWDVFRKQIPAGLNFCSSGIPYWTTDIGGFFINPFQGTDGFELGLNDDEYKELYLRWFQYGGFCPMFRAHGTNCPREIWRFGQPGNWCYDGLIKVDQLRYRLLPYIYSVGWMTTKQGYTIMRPLAFDFRKDDKVKDIKDQFLFGPAFMVNPVTQVQYFKSKGKSDPVPSSALFSGNIHGLTGEYFNGINFETKVGSRTDSAIGFLWSQSPMKGVDAEKFSIRWTGQIKTQGEGEYVFTTTNDDGVRLWIDNKLLIDDWNNHGAETKIARIKLKGNTSYSIKLEFYDNTNDALIRLGWIPPQTSSGNSQSLSRERKVYLPSGCDWYNFYAGEIQKGGQTISVATPLDIMPLFVKAGSIIPMGPVMQYAAEKQADPLELRIFPGADGDFVLYEDENDGYNYEKGQYAEIPMHWNDKLHELTIGKRNGEFKGMLKNRVFDVVIVTKNQGVGIGVSPKPDKKVAYSGESIIIKL